MSMLLATDFILFSREMKPTKQRKISQKIYGQTKGESVARPPLNTPLIEGL